MQAASLRTSRCVCTHERNDMNGEDDGRLLVALVLTGLLAFITQNGLIIGAFWIVASFALLVFAVRFISGDYL